MAEPFKNFFNVKMVSAMGQHLARAWPDFDEDGFVGVATSSLDDLELKERSAQITKALDAFLPNDFEHAASVMLTSLAPDKSGEIEGSETQDHGIAGWGIMPMADYVGSRGLEHFDLSMALLKEMTKRFTAELAIRYFILAEPRRTLSILKTWIDDPNPHVRRLISEGTRPRLPWAMRLPVFINDPKPVLTLLEKLKDDDDEYVRRSVANNLNDIAKDHPDTVAQVAARWMKGADKNRERLLKHACRTLIKQGHRDTLTVFGYGSPNIKLEKLDLLATHVTFGDTLMFSISLTSTAGATQKLVIDYAIHHRKSNGTTSPKVFKWKTGALDPSATLTAKRNHAIKKITTRTYYPGTHHLEILINGESFGKKTFELVMPDTR
ncbi:MAG: DNA alkylation repair protein [Phycisphaeraceae bacterium]|nr:DNA alkylation repair protein [Phycisphaeraceae bacterium]